MRTEIQYTRKLELEEQVNRLNDNTISLEGFFDFLFKKNEKKDKIVYDIDYLLNLIQDDSSIVIHSNCVDFNEYIKTLNDLEENVLDCFDKNIIRLTKFLGLFIQHKEKIGDFEKEAEKLGAFNISKVIIKGHPFYKSKYYLCQVSSSNSNDHIDGLEDLNALQLKVLKYPSFLEDIDFVMLIKEKNSEKIKIELNDVQKKLLVENLNKLKRKLIILKPKAIALTGLFSKTESEFIGVLKKLDLPTEMTDDEYIGFGGSMYQGLSYLYEIEKGIEDDLGKEIKKK